MSPLFETELDPAILAETTITRVTREVLPHVAATHFSTKQVSRLTGLSFRQLDYWDRVGVLCPSISEARGSGHARRYSARDVDIAKALAQLLDAGVSLQRARAVAPLLRDTEGCRWCVVGSEVVVGAEGELERLVAEAGVATVIDLGRSPPQS